MESDEDLFGESKEKGDKIEDASPFEKKGGMFSGGGTLFGTEPVSKNYSMLKSVIVIRLLNLSNDLTFYGDRFQTHEYWICVPPIGI